MFVNSLMKNSSDNSAIHNRSRNNEKNERNVSNIRLNPAAVGVQSKSDINMKQITETMISKAIDLISRTDQRIFREKQIVTDLKRFVNDKKFNLKVIPFGSATYGFGGSKTDFNICLLNNDG